MKISAINQSSDLPRLIEWVGENLQGPIIPSPANLNDHRLNAKGLYFWFLAGESYEQFSKYTSVTSLSPRFERLHDGMIYHLVYLGQAGVRNSGENNTGDLRKRLLWHILTNQNEGAVSNGAMSTFRRTLASLLSDDLLLNDIQGRLNVVLEKHFIIYFIPYTGTASDVRNQILNDEDILIRELRPLCNLMGNPNVRIIGHTTQLIQMRRRLVETATKGRLNSEPAKSKRGRKDVSLVEISTGGDFKPNKVTSSPSFRTGCITLRLKKNESIHDIIGQCTDLPGGVCRVRMYNSARTNELVYASNRSGGWRFTGKGKQTIKTFFNAPDTKANLVRWKVVKNIMNGNPVIDEVIVEVCPQESQTLPTATGTRKIPPPIAGEMAIGYEEKSPESGKVCYLIPCSSAKIKLSELKRAGKRSTLNRLTFDKILRTERRTLINMLTLASKHTRSKKPIKKQTIGFKQTATAKEVYSKGRMFSAAKAQDWNSEKAKSVYVVSALFGIVRADDFICLYDVAMDDELKVANRVIKPINFWNGKLDAAIKTLIDTHLKVYNLLSGRYEKVLSPGVLKMLTKPPIGLTSTDRSNAPLKRGKWLAEKFDLLPPIKVVAKNISFYQKKRYNISQ